MGGYARIEEFFSGWRFPVVMISVLAFLVVMMGVILAIPESGSPASEFAQDFKVWCFGYDPQTGSMEWAYLWLFLVQPFLMAGVVIVVWYRQLADVLTSSPKIMAPWIAGSFFFVALIAIGLPIAADDNVETTEFVFPAEALRTQIPAAPFALTAHSGLPLSLTEFDGKVVLITAAYTRCGLTCPFIMAEVRRIVDRVNDRYGDDLATMVITLDPAYDTPEVMNDLLVLHSLDEEQVFGLSGSEEDVVSVLDQFGFTRWVDEESGAIGHTNLFVLIDRHGNTAYRFALGETQEEWLMEALEILLSEEA